MKKAVGKILLLALGAVIFMGTAVACEEGSTVAEPTETRFVFTPLATTTPESTPPSPAETVMAKVLANPEQENAYGDKVLKTTTQYRITYIAKDDYILLSLLSTPLSEARKAAEEALLERSGNNLQALCGLKVDIGAPLYVRQGTEEVVENPHVLNICLALGK